MRGWRKSKYLGFAWAGTSASGKTEVYRVTSMSSGDLLGGVCWYGPWRQYVFEPEEGTVFNNGCLTDIADFIKEMNDAHRRRLARPDTTSKEGERRD